MPSSANVFSAVCPAASISRPSASSVSAAPDFEEAARLRDEVKRLETVDLVVSDDPLARQSAVEQAVEAGQKASGRSTAGRAGQRGGNVRRKAR